MLTASLTSLVLITSAAVLAPIVAELTGPLRVPSVVIELVLGILLGPSVLNAVHVSPVISALSDLGLSFLMFLAGFELELQRIRGRPVALAGAGWLISLALAFGAAFALVSTGLALDTLIVGLALTTTALGTLLPVLTDAGVINTGFGALVSAAGAAGEFGPILMMAVFLANKDPLVGAALVISFIAIATTTAVLATRAHPPQVLALLRRHLHSSAQLPVRVSVLCVTLLVFLAFKLGLDVLLGAFAAGIVVRQFTEADHIEVLKSKLDAIGYGFLVPIFFVVSGVQFDLHLLLTDASAWARLAMFLVLMLIVRGTPVALLYRFLGRAEQLALALFSATTLPLVVVITTIGTAEHRILPVNAAALVGAGIVSVLVYPSLGLRLVAPAPAAPTTEGAGPSAGSPPPVDPAPPDPSATDEP